MNIWTSVAPAARAPRQLLWFAACALLVGVVVYIAGRERPPALVPIVLVEIPLLTQIRLWLPEPLTAQLPSFFHAYAVLLIGATTGLAGAAVIGGTLLCVLLEAIQHPAIASALSDTLAGPLAAPVMNYAASGTFDILDLIAILLAAVTVTFQSRALARHRAGTTGSS